MPDRATWIENGAFSHGDSDLLLTDVVERTIWKISLASGQSSRLDLPLEKPTEIYRIADGYLVQDKKNSRASSDEMVCLNKDFSIRDGCGFPIKGAALNDDREVSVTYSGNTLGEGVVTFGDFRHKITGEWSSGFLSFDHSGQAKVLREFPVDSEISYQHTKANNYVTAVGKTAFVLQLGETPSLVAFEVGAKSLIFLKELPAKLSSRPAFSKDSRWLEAAGRVGNQLTAYYEILEEATAVTEIHSHRGKLWLLAREQGASLIWKLLELDTTGQVLRTFKLPVDEGVAHVSLVFGRSSVAVLQKEAVDGMGAGGWNAPYMKLRDILVFSFAWLRKPGVGAVQDLAALCDDFE